ncbi:MAG: dihydropyrimidinase [Bacillota bacterium]|nr:MAG: dihydropyrimidinase [Bacillota bacterium]
MYDLAIINGKVYQNQTFHSTNIYIEKEKIVAITQELLPSKTVIDANQLEVLPGMIDPHVHFELDLGWIKSVDDFYSGSQAAIYGGITSIMDFLEPVDNEVDLERAYHERLALAKKAMVDYTFHATMKNPTCDLEVFVKKMISLGMYTLKLFTTYSDSNRRTYDKDIYQLLKLSSKYHFLLLVHVENDDLIDLNPNFSYQDLTISRPRESETVEALKLAQFVRETKGYLYMVHLSSGKTLKALVENYSDILHKHFFVESCPQYFTFTEEKLQSKMGYLYTFAPPLRPKEDKELLFELNHHIDTIGTDHCAFMKKDKMKKKLSDVPLGIGGIEFSLPIMRKHLGDTVIQKMSERVANIQGLKHKGKIEVGYDADIVINHPISHKVKKHHGTCDYTVYQNMLIYGMPIIVIRRGYLVLDQGVLIYNQGKWIEGGPTHD